MNKFGRTIFVLLLLALLAALAIPAAAQDDVPLEPSEPVASNETGEPTHENTGLYFVEFQGAPLAAGGNSSDQSANRRDFARAARNANVSYTVRYDFRNLWNGYSLALTRGTASDLTLLNGVKAVYPVATIAIPETTPADPELAYALAMTGADVAQSELGYTGAGIRVAVMDTGVDYDHPDLGGCFGPGCRVAVGWDFVGDNFDANPANTTYNLTTVPDDDPDDCNGHGTHVSGIIGADAASPEGVTGVAPGVTFGAYRVFGCNGSTTADIMIAAMERALADDMDILNMSIGSAFQWPQYPTSAAANNLVNQGMVVVASIGNSGADGLYSAGSPGLGDKVIGVASFDNSMVPLTVFTISPDDTQIGFTPATAAPAPPTSGSFPMARTGTPTTTNDACNPLPAGSLAGQVVLIRRGTCTFHVKSLNAQNAGALGVVLYNNAPGRFSATVAGTPAITIPVVSISDAEGVLINNRLAAGPVTMTWTDQSALFPNATAGLLSSFSSYGLSPDLAFKPDLGAPGGLITSTYPLERGGYALLSGTSMSSPHVAGAAALLLEARPNVSHQAVDEILQNSADPRPLSIAPTLGAFDHTFRQGAGMLDIDDAILATTQISPSELALGEGQGVAHAAALTLKNTGASDVTYDLSNVQGAAASGTIAPSVFLPNNAAVTVSFTSLGVPVSSVTVPAGGTATVDVSITANYTNRLYGGWLVFTPQGGGQVYRVPYAGFSGDYQSLPGLTPTPANFPLLAVPTACFRVVGNECTGGTFEDELPAAFTLTDVYHMPHVLAHFEHQVQKFDIQVINATTGKSWQFALREQYLPRNQTSTGYFSFVWDGTTRGGNTMYTVPDGTYYLVVTALKAGGDPSNPAHVQTWTSPNIVIDRP